MVLQWLGAIVAALCLSPRTWAGAESYVNIHLWAAIFLGGALTLLPMALVLLRPGATLTRHVIAVCEMLFSALLIDLTGGRIETHFHIFGALALLAFYRDWRVLITASAVVAIRHGVFGCSRHRIFMEFMSSSPGVGWNIRDGWFSRTSSSSSRSWKASRG
jgi:hypothetical protein